MEVRSIKQFLEYWDSLRGRTRRVVACIPQERLEWSHRAGAFTFGDLVRHLATIERYMYAETVAGRPSRYPGCGRDLADGYDAVLEYFDRLDIEAKAIFAGLSDGDLERKCQTPAGTPITTWKWLRAMCEHEAHHRGQIYMMLNMLEVPTPPLFGLTAEEVQAGRLTRPTGSARTMPERVIPADPILRRRAVRLALAASVLGVVALTVISAHLREVSSTAIMRRWLWGAVGLMSGGGIALGCYFAWLARRILRAGEYPVPGQRVIRDTPLRGGRAAQQVAWLALGGAGVLWAASIALPLLLVRLLRLLAPG